MPHGKSWISRGISQCCPLSAVAERLLAPRTGQDWLCPGGAALGAAFGSPPSYQMCTWCPTDSRRGRKELIGGRPVWKGCAAPGSPFLSTQPCSVRQGGGRGEGQKASSWQPDWNRRLLSFSLCQLSPTESEARFEKSLSCSQHFPNTPGCCKISTGANICFWHRKSSVWVCF